MKIYIIDTGSANLNSVVQAFKRLGYEAVISSDTDKMKDADRLVLPGVGTVRLWMVLRNLNFMILFSTQKSLFWVSV